MQEQQHRIAPVIAADLDPLVSAADPDVPALVDPVRAVND
jgi:hypothetical protein